MFGIPRRSLPTVCVLCKIWCTNETTGGRADRSTLVTLYLSKVIQSVSCTESHSVVSPQLTPIPFLQAELAKLTQHESSITQLVKVAKNLIKESPELDVLVQEPMFRLEVHNCFPIARLI